MSTATPVAAAPYRDWRDRYHSVADAGDKAEAYAEHTTGPHGNRSDHG